MLKGLLKRVLIYGPLLVFAAVTLVPFVYLACGAFKAPEAFFSSPFLPTTGLFVLDENTGRLTVGDQTLLPDGDEGGDDAVAYRLTVGLTIDGEPAGEHTAWVLPGDAPRPDGMAADADVLRVPIDANAGAAIGTIAFPAFEAARDAERARIDALSPDADAEASRARPVRVSLASGNQRGALGVAWGQLTTDSFERLIVGDPPPETEAELEDAIYDPSADPNAWLKGPLLRPAVNSFFYASVMAVLATLCSAMGGYSLAKFRYVGHDTIQNLVLLALVIPGVLLLAPGYQVLYWLGLLDSYAGLIIPSVAPAFGVFLFRQAFVSGLPTEMLEAGRIDGCGEYRMFFTLGLPMVRPMVGAFMLITFLGTWNSFIWPQIVLQTPQKYPLAVAISQLKGTYNTEWGLIMAATLIAVAPVLVLFLMLQKDFIAGLTSGAVKG